MAGPQRWREQEQSKQDQDCLRSESVEYLVMQKLSVHGMVLQSGECLHENQSPSSVIEESITDVSKLSFKENEKNS